MSYNLFGLNIAKLVNDSIASAGGVISGKLHKITEGNRDIDNPLAGNVLIETEFNFKGFDEVETMDLENDGVIRPFRFVSILGASCSTVPEVGDFVTINGIRTKLTKLIELDPAKALYKFLSA